MTIRTTTARSSTYPVRPHLSLPAAEPRRVNFLALAREMDADPQLRQALQVPGTALLGVSADGVPLMIRLASPDVTHVLISATKAGGKTEAVRTMLASIALYQNARDIQFILLDPKSSAFEFLANSPHLLGDIATTPERALQHLRWLEHELERREAQHIQRPRLVVVVDDLSELLTHAGREFQVHLARLAQRGRGTGISLVVCTNKANSADLSPALRANFPVRLIGKHPGGADGANILHGRGDFILNVAGEHVRFQVAHLPPDQVPEFVARVKANHARPADRTAGLGSFVNRLRRIK